MNVTNSFSASLVRCFVASLSWVVLIFTGLVAFSESPYSGAPSHDSSTLNDSYWHQFQPGPSNTITDVEGVKVGHVTISDSEKGIQTGVTTIVPDMNQITQGQGNLANSGVFAWGQSLSGNGELTGLHWIQTFGMLNGPILLTNTLAVPAVMQGVNDYFHQNFADQWQSSLPVVGECWDGLFNRIELQSVTPAMAVKAIELASSSPVPQGRVGAGRGMRAFELHAGIGSASRQVVIDHHQYKVGVLVNMNHSPLRRLNPQIRQRLEVDLGSLETLKAQDRLDSVHPAPKALATGGSIMMILATDAPLLPHQLKLLCDRASLALGVVGSPMALHSGDFVVAFSTAQGLLLGEDHPVSQPLKPFLNSDHLNPILEAAEEAWVEAQINAVTASHHVLTKDE